MMKIRKLTEEELVPGLLDGFQHSQRITKKWVRTEKEWQLAAADELRQWSDGKRKWIPEYLRAQMESGGAAFGSFEGEKLIGFASVDGGISGEGAACANLTMLFVDDEHHRKGVGSALLREICRCAREMGAQRLFISAIPAEETVAFYFSMGCADAEQIVEQFVDTEQDRYLQLIL